MGRQLLARPLIGLAVIAAGCGSTQPAAAPRADLESVAFASPQDDLVLAAARERLVRRCMAARGFTMPPAAPAPSIPADDAPPSSGYGLLAQFDRPPPRRRIAHGTAYRHALLGSPRETATLRLPNDLVLRYRSTGCHAEAMGTLYGSVRRYQRLVAARNAVRIAAAERLERDPRLAVALAGWSRCMRLRGFPYASPTSARLGVYDAYVDSANRRRARRRELATATADRSCGQRTHVYAALQDAQREALRAMPSGERAAATAIARTRADALERARRIVRGSAGS
jgi:hypothetical protein